MPIDYQFLPSYNPLPVEVMNHFSTMMQKEHELRREFLQSCGIDESNADQWQQVVRQGHSDLVALGGRFEVRKIDMEAK